MSRIFGIILNQEKKDVIRLAKLLIDFLKSKNVEIYIEKENANILNLKEFSLPLNELLNKISVLLVLGGDGTLLSVARRAAGYDVSILGINIGGFGFLTEFGLDEFKKRFKKILNNEYYIEPRMMCEARIKRGRREIKKVVALNDVVISKGGPARILRLQTFINNEYINTYPADGLIISTPTGSTAYSLSAGGPIINPKLSVMIITPICAHTLFSRPLVISEYEEIKINVLKAPKDVILTIDGQESYSVKESDDIFICKSKFVTKLIRLKEQEFYDKLKTKLKWGGNCS